MRDQSFITFGRSGHEGEYCLNIAGYDINNYIPEAIAVRLAQLLPDWDVCNRGTRIEIFSTKFFYGYRNDPEVVSAVRQCVDDLELAGDVNELKVFALPMVQVLDGEHFEETGEVRLVKCAVLRNRADSWLVKPVEAPYFDVTNWIGDNTAFHMAWWCISKTDGSAEVVDERFDVSGLHRLVAERVSEELADIWRAESRA